MQLGGLYKKSTYINQYRKEHGDLVIVDSGDTLNEDEEIPESVMAAAKLKAELIARIYEKIGIDAVNVGELDLVLGIDFLKELSQKENFPFVSANLVDSENKLIFKPYVIKNINGKNIGIFGIIGDTSDMVDRVKEITKDTAHIQDPIEAAASMVKELSGKVDYTIALTHQSTNRNWVIARRVKGINLVVGGHAKQKTETPYEADKTLIVQAGEKGQYLGLLEVALDGSTAPQNKLVPLGDDIANDPEIKTMISNYNDALANMYSGTSESKPSPNNVTLRLAVCEPCHAEQVSKWKTTDHAHAYETLVEKSKQFDPKCLMCHTTRFEQPEGFSMKLQQMELVNVQCETCHGFAKEHLSDMKPIPVPHPQISVCLKCHTEDRCPEFEKDAKIVFEKIKH